MSFEEIRQAAELRGYAPEGLMKLAAALCAAPRTRKKREFFRKDGARRSPGC